MRRAFHTIRALVVALLAATLLGAPQVALAGHYIPVMSETAKNPRPAPADTAKLLAKKHQQGGQDDVDGGHEHELSLVAAVAILSAARMPEAPIASKSAPAPHDPDSLLPRPADPPLPRPPSTP